MSYGDDYDDRAGHELRAEKTYPVFGKRVEVRFLGWDGCAVADESFRGWNVLLPADIDADDPTECSTIVMKKGEAPTAPPKYTVTDEDLVVEEGAVTMYVDRGEGRACILAPLAAVDQARREYQKLFLECAVLFLASRQDRVPVHAAGAVIDGRTVLLVAPTGGGKSTLLYALLRQGCSVLGEESVCIAYRDTFALWGNAREIGLCEDALTFFPDLSRAAASLQPNGKTKYLAPIRTDRIAYPKQTGPVDIVFLAQGPPTEEAIRPIETAAARELLTTNRAPGFNVAPDYNDAIDALLAHARCWQLARHPSPASAADALLHKLKSN